MATEIQTERGIVRVPTGTWTVDRAHSSIEFRVKHMMVSTVRGRFTEFEGTIRAAPDYHDSRVWGTVPRDNLVGPLIVRYWPPGRVDVG